MRRFKTEEILIFRNYFNILINYCYFSNTRDFYLKKFNHLYYSNILLLVQYLHFNY